MKKTLFILQGLLCISLLLLSCANDRDHSRQADTANTGTNALDTLFQDSNYVVLRKMGKAPDSKKFLDGPIRDAHSLQMINDFRNSIPASESNTASRYVHVNYNELTKYLNDQISILQNAMPAMDPNKLGVRIYYAKDDQQRNTMLLSVTYDHKALWQDSRTNNPALYPMEAFDEMGICPNTCGEDDIEVIVQP